MNRRCTRPLTLAILSAGLGHVLWSVEVSSSIAPSQFRVETLTAAINEQGPATGAMSVVRLAMLAASAYVAVVMLLTVIARATRRRSLEGILARLTPRALRPVLGVLAVSSVFVPQAAYAGSSDQAPVMVRIDDTPTSTISTTTIPTATVPTANTPTTNGPSMRWLGPAPSMDTPPRSPVAPTADAPPGEALAPGDPTSTAPDPTAATWTVEPGDHFWHIAEATLLGRLDRLPTVQETHTYWNTLIAANHGRLRDPGNRDLIYPGQQFVLPDT